MADVKPIPDEYPRVFPYLCVDGAAEAIEFYTKVLGATERMRMPTPEGKIEHAELQIGDSMITLSDEFSDMGFRSPKHAGETSVIVNVYVDDVDAAFRLALDLGATSVRDIENQFYGDRTGQFEGPFGHRWSIATHVEDVLPDEMARRAAQRTPG